MRGPQSFRPADRRWKRAALSAGLLFAFVQPSFESRAQTAQSPLESLAGSWSGSGTITLASGDREPIRCRGTYKVGNGGRTVEQGLRCASDSYKFDVDGKFSFNAAAGGTISGTWQEKNYKNGGVLTGTARGGSIKAR